VSAILQTRDGYLWLGTSAGLFRFDGVTFTEVNIDPQDSNAHEPITTLYQTRDGSLLIGTVSVGLRVFKDGRMSSYDARNGLYSTHVRGFFETRAGHLLMAVNNGLFLFKDGRFSQIVLDQNFINGIAEDPQGRIWVGTVDGVRIFYDDGSTNPTVTPLREGLPYPSVLNVFGDREGNMWVGTYGGLARFMDGKATTYTTANALTNDRILAICEDSDGNLWVGTQKGINRFTDGAWTSFMSSGGLTDNNVFSFAEDREHSLWVGTSNGLDQFEDPNITTYTTSEGLASDNVTSIVEARDSSIYFFADDGPIMTRLKDGKFIKYGNLSIPAGSAFASRDGSIWVSQTGALLNFKDGKLKRYDEKAGVPQTWISAIAEDDKGLIFYANQVGLLRLVHGRAVPYLLKDGKQYPKDDFIVCLLYQKDGTLWIGKGSGLARIQNGALSTFTEREEVGADWISSLYDDQQGGLWISSTPGGLILFKDGKFTFYNTKIGLFSKGIYRVLGDNLGGIWMSSGKGIGYVKRQELEDFAQGKIKRIHTIVYGAADGMKVNPSFNRGQPSGIKSYDGRIWFTTQKGAMVINPGGFTKNELAPPVLIENVIADQHPVSPDSFATFSAGTDKLEFHYNGLSFKVPQKVVFKYKLEGYDHAWIDAGTRRVAYYTNLLPGNYEFLVIACNNDGIWNSSGANFSFELRPYFYETYWFYAFVLVMVGGAGFGVYRIRVWQLLKREKELNARIQEALAHIKTLGGLIPICSNCKKIRDDEGYWEILEKYIQTHADVQFSHGICPDCYAKLYPDFPIEKARKNEKLEG
jgi:ligand-binding sensor domain-containing protein